MDLNSSESDGIEEEEAAVPVPLPTANPSWRKRRWIHNEKTVPMNSTNPMKDESKQWEKRYKKLSALHHQLELDNYTDPNTKQQFFGHLRTQDLVEKTSRTRKKTVRYMPPKQKLRQRVFILEGVAVKQQL